MSVMPAPAPAARFARLIAALCAAVAARNIRPGKPGLAGPLIVAIWTRLNRMARRVTRLAARVEAGTLTPPRQRPAAPRHSRPRPPPTGIRLPRGFAWLVPLVPEIAFGARQLRVLLDDPEMQALIQAAPQIGRTLRPLCHLLGLQPLPPILHRPPLLSRTPPRSAEADRPLPAAPPPGAPPRARPPRPPRPKPPAPEVARGACGPPVPA